jgi:hypothetical protein
MMNVAAMSFVVLLVVAGTAAAAPEDDAAFTTLRGLRDLPPERRFTRTTFGGDNCTGGIMNMSPVLSIEGHVPGTCVAEHGTWVMYASGAPCPYADVHKFRCAAAVAACGAVCVETFGTACASCILGACATGLAETCCQTMSYYAGYACSACNNLDERGH